MKKTGQKTKLRGEIALAGRQIVGRKKTFGIELYDLVTNDKQKLLSVAAGTAFKGQQDSMKEPFERARDDIAGIQARKDIKQKDLDVLEVKGAHTLPDTTMGQKASKAGRAISEAGTGTKLRAEMALLDREMKIRKEQFGIEVFDLSVASDEGSTKKGIAKRVSAAMESETEKVIQACIDQAKKDVAFIQTGITSKQREIGSIDEEMEPLAS
eukprot:CAMPEP_0117005066 /NCGR_PEP_ID=MMETSP0472-20121206/5821_1 /TAXON_ID=693140 ORGANISM="Tiarina fusus, Strain LIS" /NCGR_SAMPLE_ID=MMETSP0472 /ASSEMBLY_ACC=CAM_ASM_000603 /LENGTH=211 /DNA_ID=CAMNT_0004706213 /DNA_START=122 /DNA_END=757 /DNA_ORIENTATION=-